MRVILAALAVAVTAAVSALASTPTRFSAIRGAAADGRFDHGAHAAKTPIIGAGNLPFYLGYGAKCRLVWNEIGCTLSTTASTSQTRLITCATSGPVAAMVPLAGGVPYGSAVSGVLPRVEITGVADADVAITSGGWDVTQSGPVYESTIDCHAAMLQKDAYRRLQPFAPTNFTARDRDGAAAPAAADADTDLGINRPRAEITMLGGGSRVETVAVEAKSQTEPFYFQSPTLGLPDDTPVVISNMAVNGGQCDVAGGQPFALISTVYADRVALDCTDVGDNVCGSKLCTIPALTSELLIEMVPYSLGSSDALQAGISVSPAE